MCLGRGARGSPASFANLCPYRQVSNRRSAGACGASPSEVSLLADRNRRAWLGGVEKHVGADLLDQAGGRDLEEDGAAPNATINAPSQSTTGLLRIAVTAASYQRNVASRHGRQTQRRIAQWHGDQPPWPAHCMLRLLGVIGA